MVNIYFTYLGVNALSGLYFISTVPLQKPRFYAGSRSYFCRYLSEYSDNILFLCMFIIWTYLSKFFCFFFCFEYNIKHLLCHPFFLTFLPKFLNSRYCSLAFRTPLLGNCSKPFLLSHPEHLFIKILANFYFLFPGSDPPFFEESFDHSENI